MKLYVCYGTWTAGKPLHPHPCGEAHVALREAGYKPEVVRALGLGPLPGFLNDLTPRREVRELTGQYWVPALVTDDGEAIAGSERIIAWAHDHPAGAAGDESVGTAGEAGMAAASPPRGPSASAG